MTRHRKHFREDILEYINEYKTQNGFAPSVDDMADEFGTVKSNIYHHLTVLESEGLLAHVTGKARSWTIKVPN